MCFAIFLQLMAKRTRSCISSGSALKNNKKFLLLEFIYIKSTSKQNPHICFLFNFVWMLLPPKQTFYVQIFLRIAKKKVIFWKFFNTFWSYFEQIFHLFIAAEASNEPLFLMCTWLEYICRLIFVFFTISIPFALYCPRSK